MDAAPARGHTSIAMLHTLTVCASLGFGILVSPEILIIGLLLASDRSHPRANTLGYFLGSAAGITLLLGLGYVLTHSTGSSHSSGAGWWLRVIFGVLLVGLGVHTFWKQLHKKPQDAKPHQKNSLGSRLLRLLPVSEDTRPGGPLPSLAICTGLSFLLTVVHVKTAGLAMGAGHQLHAMQTPSGLAAGLTAFLIPALLPTLIPLGLAVFSPQTAVQARKVSQAVAEKHGGWILAVIFLLIGLDFLHGALGG